MKCLPALCLFLMPYFSLAQRVPDSVTYSPDTFARYLQGTQAAPSDQLSVLYGWIKENIAYSKDSFMYFNWNAGSEDKVSATLRRRKGVCENFAALFADISGRLGFRSIVVHGYPALGNKTQDNSHSWVAIQQNQEWYLCDPTWDAQSGGEKYYMKQPAEFIQTHIPFDPLWQLMEKPLNYDTRGGKFMFRDSVTAFLQLDSLEQIFAAERRITNSGFKNNMTVNWQRHNQMNVAIIAGEADMKSYNAAVAYLNSANKYFNAFVQYRNAQFNPVKPDEEIKAMLLPIDPLLRKAESSLKSMGKLRDNFQYDPGLLFERIANLEKKLYEQNLFLSTYIQTISTERVKLFYR